MILVLTGNLVEGVETEIQILPFGQVHSKKGDFLVDDKAVADILASFAAQKNDLVIDYEHQTLDGVQAPAAGWIKELVNKGEEGIWARVEWTERAKDYLANKEYRYFSPVVWVRKSDGRAAVLHSGALTNTPAIDGMVPLANKEEPLKEDNSVDELLQQLRWMLNMTITATAEEVIAELQKVINQLKDAQGLVANKEVLSLLEVPETADINTVKGKILALKNPSGYVRVEEFNSLKEQLATRQRDELVNMALSQGKVSPAMKEWAEQYALKDPAGFKAFIDQAPQVVPIGQDITGGANFKHQEGLKPDEAQLMVNKMLGIDEDAYKKFGGDQ